MNNGRLKFPVKVIKNFSINDFELEFNLEIKNDVCRIVEKNNHININLKPSDLDSFLGYGGIQIIFQFSS